MSLPTLTDLKLHLNKPESTDNDELADMLDAAVDVVSGIIGPVASGSVTETHYGLSSDVLVLRRMPVVDLTAVSARVGATTTPLTLADYELDPSTGIVRVANGSPFYGNYTVTYTAGLETVPAAIRLAILIVAAHLWETQRGNTGGGPLAADSDPSFGISPGVGFAIPNRAKELLEPYARGPQIA